MSVSLREWNLIVAPPISADDYRMRCFGLTPDSVLARSPDLAGKAAPSLVFSMAFGALSFGLVSVIAYSIWAYSLIPGTAAMYTSIAAIYLGLTGLALSRLVLGSGATTRFVLLFASAFFVYAVAWCVFWFGLGGRHEADLWGAAVGLAGMTWVIRRAFGKTGDFLPLFAVLFTCHTLGYYLGDVLYAAVRGAVGRLLWGAGHGLGFGAGLGYVLSHVQAPLKVQVGQG